MVTVFCSAGAACLVADLVGLSGAGGRHGGFFALVGRRGGRTQRDARDRFAAQRIVAEDGEARKDSQKQAQQDGECLNTGKRQPKPALPARRLLSERCAQIVGHFCHRSPRINGLDDTTARRGRGRYATARVRRKPDQDVAGNQWRPSSKKGGPKAALFAKPARGV